MADAEIAIQARGLSKVLGNCTIFRDVDLDIAEGRSVALTGKNGAGKTTFLRCLASLLRPSTGEVRWFGRPVTANPAVRGLIGLVGHESHLYPQLTLRENLVFSGRMYGVPRPKCRADRLLRKAGLQHHACHLPGDISNGMRRRLAITRALMHDPPILLLDEPFAGLDAHGCKWLVDLLLDCRRRGRTVCFSAHGEHEVRQLADRIVCLDGGRLHELEMDERIVSAGPGTSARAA